MAEEALKRRRKGGNFPLGVSFGGTDRNPVLFLEDTDGGFCQVTETMATMFSWRVVELPTKVEFMEEIFTYLMAAKFMKALAISRQAFFELVNL